MGSLITHRPTASLDELQCKLTAVGYPPSKGLVNRSVDNGSSEQRQWHHTWKGWKFVGSQRRKNLLTSAGSRHAISVPRLAGICQALVGSNHCWASLVVLPRCRCHHHSPWTPWPRPVDLSFSGRQIHAKLKSILEGCSYADENHRDGPLQLAGRSRSRDLLSFSSFHLALI